MTDPSPNPGQPSIETTRIGGGISWKLGLAVVSAVLVGVVGVGIAGRPPAPAPPPVVADVASQAPTAEPANPGAGPGIAQPTPGRPVAAVDAPPNRGRALTEHYALIAMLGEQMFVWPLTETAPGHLAGTYDIPVPPPATRGSVELARAPLTGSDNTWGPLASWQLNLESLSAASGRDYVVLDRVIRPRPRAFDQPLPVRNGYQIKVRAESGVNGGRVKIDVFLGSGRNRLQGDDGIFGWPNVALIPGAAPHVPAPRGVYNFCRWDVGPMALPPRPGTDESNCGG